MRTSIAGFSLKRAALVLSALVIIAGGVILATGLFARHTDAAVNLEVDGRVADRAGNSLAGVSVFFLDTRSEVQGRAREVLVGETSEGGQLRRSLTYLCGHTSLLGSRGSELTFRLSFRRHDLAETSRSFTLGSLVRRGDVVIVPFDVQMTPR